MWKLTVFFGIHCGALDKLTLLDKYHPIRGAKPAFFAVPPSVLVLLIIEAEFRAILDPDISTIIYYVNII
jgi:hypothetical protein